MQRQIEAAGSACHQRTWDMARISAACATALLLWGCASAPAEKAAGAGFEVSALEAQGPLDLPFGSVYRWLNFPMYHNDNAHAVDLGALRWRSDTLLQTASRYPLHSGGSWPKELYGRAWYEYEKRLVDCRTGHAAALSEALLDRDGQVLLERPAQSSLDRMIDRSEAGKRWLASSEIGLACLAAGDPLFLNQRREAASQPAPRLSHLPISALLKDDAELLRGKLDLRIDEAKLQAVKTQGAEAILASVTQQRAQRQRELHGPGAETKGAKLYWSDAATREALEKRINTRNSVLPFKALPNGEFERWEDVRRPEPTPKPPDGVDAQKLQDAEVVALRRSSCLSGSALSTRYRWYGWRSGEMLAERPATPDESLASLRSVDHFCQQLNALAYIQKNEEGKDLNAEEKSHLEQLVKAPKTPEVWAEILLTLRKLRAADEAQP